MSQKSEEYRKATTDRILAAVRNSVLASVREVAEGRINNGLLLDAIGGVEAEARLRVLSGLILADVAECMAQDDAGYPAVDPVEVVSQADRLIRLTRERDEAIARAGKPLDGQLAEARAALRRESDRADRRAAEAGGDPGD